MSNHMIASGTIRINRCKGAKRSGEQKGKIPGRCPKREGMPNSRLTERTARSANQKILDFNGPI